MENNATVVQWKMTTEKIGVLYLVASEKGLQGVFWKKQPVPELFSLNCISPTHQLISQAAIELEEYFSGIRENFEIPLDIQGTSFQKEVWNQLRKIPYGHSYSYKDISNQLSFKSAWRAIGNANGKNPLSIIIPCHRVIASNGGLGGYAGGLSIKTQLLELERLRTKNKTAVH